MIKEKRGFLIKIFFRKLRKELRVIIRKKVDVLIVDDIFDMVK